MTIISDPIFYPPKEIMTLIQYLCAICGTGKTRALARYAKCHASNGEKARLGSQVNAISG
jgi:hypothetical protein